MTIMEISIDDVKKCLSDNLELDGSTFRYKNGGGLNREPKEVRYQIIKRLDLVIRWDYLYGIDQTGGAMVSIETDQNYVLTKTSWPEDHNLLISEFLLTAKLMLAEFADRVQWIVSSTD